MHCTSRRCHQHHFQACSNYKRHLVAMHLSLFAWLCLCCLMLISVVGIGPEFFVSNTVTVYQARASKHSKNVPCNIV